MQLKYKIVLAGAKDVGKSSLIARFCDNVFNENMRTTIGVSFKRKKIPLPDLHKKLAIEVNIWDFGGEEKYRTLFPAYVNGAAAALILFDTTDRKTLDDIDNWVDIIKENTDSDIVMLLIGTKIDLKDQRQITNKQAREIYDKCDWCIDIIETSAKTGENVEEAFLTVAKEIVKRKMQLCKNCKKYFSKKLKFCNYCGEQVEIEVIAS
ncbi:MAG: Rab family GTPase [Promethearchaeota archaeon]